MLSSLEKALYAGPSIAACLHRSAVDLSSTSSPSRWMGACSMKGSRCARLALRHSMGSMHSMEGMEERA